jgi:uncharacterized 2Fe-2S/4Fe-4S cluster protein (DUF4445 family)
MSYTIQFSQKKTTVVARIMEIDMTEKDIDIINRSKHAFRITTLILGARIGVTTLVCLIRIATRVLWSLKR